MDKQPLNTGEQKDMTEFFTDLITKMEEMSQELVKELWDNRSPSGRGDVPDPLEQADVCLLQKNTVKTLFGGVITNNVVSLVSPRARPPSSWTSWTRPDQLDRGGDVDLFVLLCRTVTTSARPPRSSTPSGVRWPT